MHTFSVQEMKLNDLQDLCKDTGRCFNGEDDGAIFRINDVNCFTWRGLREVSCLHGCIVEFPDDLSVGMTQQGIIKVYLGFIIVVRI